MQSRDRYGIRYAYIAPQNVVGDGVGPHSPLCPVLRSRKRGSKWMCSCRSRRHFSCGCRAVGLEGSVLVWSRAPARPGGLPRHGLPPAPGPGAAGAAAGGHPLPPSGCLRPSVPGKHLSGGYLFIYVFIFPHQAAILPQQAASEAVEAVRGRAPRPVVGPAMGALVCVLPDTAPGDMLGTRGHGPTPHSLRKRIPEAPIGGEIPPKSQPCSFYPGIKATLPRYPVGQGFSPFTCKDFGL